MAMAANTAPENTCPVMNELLLLATAVSGRKLLQINQPFCIAVGIAMAPSKNQNQMTVTARKSAPQMDPAVARKRESNSESNQESNYGDDSQHGS